MNEVAYRIDKAKYSGSHEKMFSGEGAALRGGRWNSADHKMVYASDSRALATLEIIVRLEKDAGVLNKYCVCEMSIPEELCETVTAERLPNGWNGFSVNPRATRSWGDDWLKSGKTPVIKIPSVVVPKEWNYLINPQHAEFKRSNSAQLSRTLSIPGLFNRSPERPRIIVFVTRPVMMNAEQIKPRAEQRARENSPVRFLGIRRSRKPTPLFRLVEKGLPTRSIAVIARNLDIPESEFAARYADITRRTFSRRKREGKLSVNESDRVVRYAKLLHRATNLMIGDQDAAVRWLKAPKLILGKRTPLEHARTEAGATEVNQLIGRIRHGVFSDWS